MNDEKYYCQINKNGFALAVSMVMSAFYIICAIFVTLWPNFTIQLFGWLLHVVNVEKFASDVVITFSGFILGLLQVLIYTYICTWLIIWSYNKFIIKK